MSWNALKYDPAFPCCIWRDGVYAASTNTEHGTPEGNAQLACELTQRYNEYDALKAENERLRESHKRLMEFMEAELHSEMCTCKLLEYVGKIPPCERCQKKALISAARKLREGQ